ncbi:ferritin-like domain-containing protein [Candidatus Woesearchaeota archaeon]|nr:ferritin-like domain-containing protein [Candidatus Woesearchaeota archaeon]
MYDQKGLLRVLKKNLGSELFIIKYYVENLERLNYKDNKEDIDKLIIDSTRHATMLIKEILNLSRNVEGKLSKSALRRALKEEEGLKSIYEYEKQRTSDAKARQILERLIGEEKKHQEIVRGLR